MNISRIINIFCLTAGVCVIVFGVLVRTGAFPNIDIDKSTLIFILGTVIVLWAFLSIKKRK